MLLAIAIASSSCSVLNPSSKKSSATVASGAQAVKVEKIPATADNGSKAGNDVVAEVTDSQTNSVPVTEVPTMKSDLARKLGGEWTIIQVGTTVIDRDEGMPYIIFQPSTARFFANNGCNTVNGSYSVDSGDCITFHSIMSTLRLCPDVDFENQINAIITENVPVKIQISEVGKESFAEFVNAQGKAIMRMRRGNLDFLNGQWNIESVTGLNKLETPADIFFDLGELRLHGDTGCNIVNGNIYLDHRMSNAVDFSHLATTRMGCPEPIAKQQTAILVALEETVSAISDGSDKVMLLGSDGRILMTLVRAAQDR